MAIRIEVELIRAEIDNRIRGRMTGRLWLVGLAEPVELDLVGDAWRDVAGRLVVVTNPRPSAAEPAWPARFAGVQRGSVGDVTVSRKVRVPTGAPGEWQALIAEGKPFPWHWGNSVYLEWYSEQHGRIVIEGVGYQVDLGDEPTWILSEAEERAQREARGSALADFFAGAEVVTENEVLAGDAGEDGDEPVSEAEAAADAEDARMELLLDRVQARIERAEAAGEPIDFETILDEERQRLRRERGEPDEPLEAESGEDPAWSAAVPDWAEAEPAEGWQPPESERMRHPLVERCSGLAMRLAREVEERGWLDEEDQDEHPLREAVHGVMFAGAKLAGCLMSTAEDAWPPRPLFAGSVLVRLKKARGHLRDALAGLAMASELGIAGQDWVEAARVEVAPILFEVMRRIEDVRAVLQDHAPEDDEVE